MPRAWFTPRRWAVLGVAIWAPVAVFLGVWGQLRDGPDWVLPWEQAVCTLAVLSGARWVAAAAYRRRSGVPSTAEAPTFGQRVETRVLLRPFAFSAVPFGILMGTLANLWGWGILIPWHWVVLPVALMLGGWLYGAGSVVLYNGLVLPWCAGRVGAPMRRLHRALALTGFAWVVALSTVIAGVGSLLLLILAHRWPSGWFGLEVTVFGWAAVVFMGFWICYGLSWWYAWVLMRASSRRSRQLA